MIKFSEITRVSIGILLLFIILVVIEYLMDRYTRLTLVTL